MSQEKEILDAELLMLKSEVLESKIYIEIGAITLLFVITMFINDVTFRNHVELNQTYKYISILVTLIIALIIIYLFINITFTIYRKMYKIKEQEKMFLRDFTKDDDN